MIQEDKWMQDAMNMEAAYPRILVVDDEPLILDTITRIFQMDNYAVFTAQSGREALAILDSIPIHVVVTDYCMPGMNGIDFLKEIRRHKPEIIRLVISGCSDIGPVIAAINEGHIYKFIPKPWNTDELKRIISEAVEYYSSGQNVIKQRNDLEKNNESLQILISHLSQIVSYQVSELEDSLVRIKKVMENTIQAVAITMEKRDPYTAGHQRRTSELCCAIADLLDISERIKEGLRLAATIHDIGKISLPVEFLAKPTRLTDMEFEWIKTHVDAGYEILKEFEFPWPVAEIVYQHHERTDGTGYPRGLNGNDILLEARILAVADTVEAMASHRPYRNALGIEVALDEIKNNKGKKYDPYVSDACICLFEEQKYSFEKDPGAIKILRAI
jgi:putative two-component system response regulator